jgi:hypothetical protein
MTQDLMRAEDRAGADDAAAPALAYDDRPPGSRLACEVAGDALLVSFRPRGAAETLRKVAVPLVFMGVLVALWPLMTVLTRRLGAPPSRGGVSPWRFAGATGLFVLLLLGTIGGLVVTGWRKVELRLDSARLVLTYRKFFRERRYEWAREELVGARAVERFHLERLSSATASPPVELHVDLTGGRAVALNAAIPTAFPMGPVAREDLEWLARRLNEHLKRTAPSPPETPR